MSIQSLSSSLAAAVITPLPEESTLQLSDTKKLETLKNHLNFFSRQLVEAKLVDHAVLEKTPGDLDRCVSGIPIPYYNSVVGCPSIDWDKSIEEQIDYFKGKNLDFIWQLDVDSHPSFEKKLLDRGFIDGGVFQGVIGVLKDIPDPEVAPGFSLELVESESAMNEFCKLVCDTFEIPEGKGRDDYQKFLTNSSEGENRSMYHWLARNEKGEAVSTVSTVVEGDVVSFWHGASLEEVRRKGLSTSLRRMALQHATEKGCKIGSSYLMAGAMAGGICKTFGYESVWQYKVFLSPGVGGH